MIIKILAILFCVALLPRVFTGLFSRTSIQSFPSLPNIRTAIVFGAGLNRDGSPTLVLRDRVKTAADLYFAGKVEKILLSGDNRFVDYNEPAAMKSYAMSLGVPEDVLVLDYAGRRTYDTCYRAQAIFGLSEAILVTQKFHLPRAIFICKSLGIKTAGIQADQNYYRKLYRLIWNIRETAATFAALWDVWIAKPLPVLGNPEPIYTNDITTSDKNISQ